MGMKGTAIGIGNWPAVNPAGNRLPGPPVGIGIGITRGGGSRACG
jgi:hypothetical protein